MNHQAAGRNVNVPMMRDGKILYCAVLAITQPDGKVKTEEIFTHAHTVGEARWNVAHTIDNIATTQIVSIGPAVGVHCDDNGEKLSL